MGRRGARGAVKPIFTQFYPFRPYFFSYLNRFIFLSFIRIVYPEIIHRSLYNPLVNWCWCSGVSLCGRLLHLNCFLSRFLSFICRLQVLSIEREEIDSYSLDVLLCKSKKRQIYLPRSILQSATKQNKLNSMVQCPFFFLLIPRATYLFLCLSFVLTWSCLLDRYRCVEGWRMIGLGLF